MFQTTRLKLTAWYLLILMLITGLFSGIIYYGMSNEIEKGFNRAQKRLESQELLNDFFIKRGDGLFPGNHLYKDGLENVSVFLFVDDLSLAKKRLLINLLTINGAIFFLVAWASYLIAGKSLEPIETAVNEQKRFISDASHELRTPVTALRTALEVNLKDRKLTKYARSLMEENLKDVENMSRLVNNLLHLAKNGGAKKLSFSQLNCAELLKKSIKAVQPMATKKKIKIYTVFNFSNKLISGSADALQELFTIVLDNAVKFTPSKGEISVLVTGKGRRLQVQVKDNGIGVAKQHLPHLFDRFYRADDARGKEKVDGFGLGLALAKQIVLQHGGSIEIKSDFGKGTTVIIVL